MKKLPRTKRAELLLARLVYTVITESAVEKQKAMQRWFFAKFLNLPEGAADYWSEMNNLQPTTRRTMNSVVAAMDRAGNGRPPDVRDPHTGRFAPKRAS